MKRNLYLVVVLFAGLGISTAYAQTSAGGMVLGGQFNFSSSESGGSSTNTFGFAPEFGYFVADNLAIGLGLSIGNTKQDGGLTDYVHNSFGIAPAARYYVFTPNDRFAFFGHAQLSFASGKTEYNPGTETKTSTISFAIRPGFSWFFNDHWAVEFSTPLLSYNVHDPNKDVDDNNQTNFSFGLNTFSPAIGFRYYFGN